MSETPPTPPEAVAAAAEIAALDPEKLRRAFTTRQTLAWEHAMGYPLEQFSGVAFSAMLAWFAEHRDRPELTPDQVLDRDLATNEAGAVAGLALLKKTEIGPSTPSTTATAEPLSTPQNSPISITSPSPPSSTSQALS